MLEFIEMLSSCAAHRKLLRNIYFYISKQYLRFSEKSFLKQGKWMLMQEMPISKLQRSLIILRGSVLNYSKLSTRVIFSINGNLTL